MDEGRRKEDEAAMKMTEQIRSQEDDLMNRINEQNEETRNALLEEFKERMKDGGSALTDSDKQALFQDFADRIDRMSAMLAGEQSAQSKRL
jgi:hypothetical protein